MKRADEIVLLELAETVAERRYKLNDNLNSHAKDTQVCMIKEAEEKLGNFVYNNKVPGKILKKALEIASVRVAVRMKIEDSFTRMSVSKDLECLLTLLYSTKKRLIEQGGFIEEYYELSIALENPNTNPEFIDTAMVRIDEINNQVFPEYGKFVTLISNTRSWIISNMLDKTEADMVSEATRIKRRKMKRR